MEFWLGILVQCRFDAVMRIWIRSNPTWSGFIKNHGIKIWIRAIEKETKFWLYVLFSSIINCCILQISFKTYCTQCTVQVYIYLNVHFLVDKKCFYESHFPSFIYFKQMFFFLYVCFLVFQSKIKPRKGPEPENQQKIHIKKFYCASYSFIFPIIPKNTKKWTWTRESTKIYLFNRAGNSLIGFLSESLIKNEQMSNSL